MSTIVDVRRLKVNNRFLIHLTLDCLYLKFFRIAKL